MNEWHLLREEVVGALINFTGRGSKQACEQHRSVTGSMSLSDHNFIFSLISLVLYRLSFKLTYVGVSYVGRTH